LSREAEIKLKVKLDEENIPEEIYWEASEAEEPGLKKCEAIMMSMWDKEKKNSLTIDLWTKKMEVGEMNAHYYFTLMKLAETYERATNNKELSEKIKNFANDFANSVEEFAKPDH